MIPKECKRLAEVDFPIAVVSKHAAREKSIRHGHPSTLHLWWARRPLAACRAMLLGLLLPDPCDEHCPEEFKRRARELLPKVQGHVSSEEQDLRRALLKFIGDFSSWDLATDRTYLDISRNLVRAAYPEEIPVIADSFAGGGSIPLEALRVGCDAFANDLNPIPVLLCRVLLEDVPRFGTGLIDAVEKAVKGLNSYLANEIGQLYPSNSSKEETTAYLWARTVNCESPHCGVTFPLLRSLWLSRKQGSSWTLRIKKVKGQGGKPEIIVSVSSWKEGDEIGSATVTGGRAVCPGCSVALPRSSIETQLKARRGGTDSATLVAVMVAKENGRVFRAPVARDLGALEKAREIDEHRRDAKFDDGISMYPDEYINPIRPSPNARGLSAVTRYGMATFSDCYLPRQRIVLSEIARFLRRYSPDDPNISGAVGRCLLILMGRCVDRWSSCCRLDSTRDTVTGSFSKQALQMVWDFCEANPFSKWSGGLDNASGWIMKALEHALKSVPRSAHVQIGDARVLSLPDQSVQIWFTDPPYYDSVPYADLADCFYCWLRRAHPGDPFFMDVFDRTNTLTPKNQECVWNQSYSSDGRRKDSKFFEECVSVAFAEARRSLDPAGLGCIVFAHKSTEGWEALLSGIVRAGLSITSSWPIQTEMKARTAAREAASLMGSVHLLCRPRSENAAIGDWSDVLRELPKRVGDWMERLQSEGIRGTDLLFACIGPALEIFSHYSKVETAEGQQVGLAEYLEKVWEVIGRLALKQILKTDEPSEFGEDARLTALFLWTIRSSNGQSDLRTETSRMDETESENSEDIHEYPDGRPKTSPKTKGGYTLPYDIVRRFSQPLGIHLERWKGRLIDIDKGLVRLLPITERAELLLGQTTAQDVRAAETPGSRNSRQQLGLFGDLEKLRTEQERLISAKQRLEQTTWSHLHKDTIPLLDHVHQAMLFQKQGQTTALRELLFYEQAYRPEFVRLANALSVLYPKESEEKRLLDALLLTMPK